MVVVVSPPQGHGPGRQGPGSHNLCAPGCTRSGAAAWGLLLLLFRHQGALFGSTWRLKAWWPIRLGLVTGIGCSWWAFGDLNPAPSHPSSGHDDQAMATHLQLQGMAGGCQGHLANKRPLLMTSRGKQRTVGKGKRLVGLSSFSLRLRGTRRAPSPSRQKMSPEPE